MSGTPASHGPENTPNGQSVPKARNDLSADLTDPAAGPRSVVEAGNKHAEQVVEGPSYADETKLIAIGRRLLTKVGLYDPTAPDKPKGAWRQDNAEREQTIQEELERSREALRNTFIDGVHDAVVDSYIGLRDEGSLLPRFFHDLHSQAEAALGRELTFLDWMANHATSEQLLNVWQWHDDYLQRADAEPAFSEMTERVKKGFALGLDAAIGTGELHPDMRVAEADIAGMQIRHASPLSPYTATMVAHAHKASNSVMVSGRNFKGNEATLYHELTHLVKPGLVTVIGEAATDRIAAVAYNHAHPGGAPFDEVADSPYGNEHHVLASIETMTRGAVGLFEISQTYAGDSGARNMLELSDKVQQTIGLPLLEQAAMYVYRLSAGHGETMEASELMGAQGLILRNIISLFEDALAQSGMQRISSRADFNKLTAQLLKTGLTDDRYSQDALFSALEVATMCFEDMEKTGIFARG